MKISVPFRAPFVFCGNNPTALDSYIADFFRFALRWPIRFFNASSKTGILASHSRIFWERNEQGMEVFVLLDRSSLRPKRKNQQPARRREGRQFLSSGFV